MFAGAAAAGAPGVSAWPQAAASTAQAASAAARVAIAGAGAAASGGGRLVRRAGSVHEQFLGELAMQITDAAGKVQRNGE